MKIGLLGVGHIGETLVRKLSASGFDVRFANSRGPETLADLAEETGAQAVTSADAVREADVIILSIPLSKMPDIRAILANVDEHIPIIDTSNYMPHRDGNIIELDDGKVESVWVQTQIGRPVIRAWNAVLSGTFKEKGRPRDTAERLAIPVAGDDQTAKQIAMTLVDATGFDAVDAGTIDESWRIQPGTPAYCSELSTGQMNEALKIADRNRSASRRDAYVKAIFAFGEDPNAEGVNDDMVRLQRAIMRFP